MWTSEMAYGARPPGGQPFFVVSHSVPDEVRLTRELGMQFSFVDGLSAAVERARTAADGRHVVIMGGGDVIGQAVELDLVDELHLHLSPLVLGGGTSLFKRGTVCAYRQRGVRASANAVHVVYERGTRVEE